MAVYEQTYKRYAGNLTPEWSRFLIIPRHTLRGVFNYKLFTAFFVICFVPLLVEAILIYLHHNVTALAITNANIKDLVPIDGSFFQTFVNIQGGFAFVLAILVGPPLVSRDLRNNALPLYLCRPFSRTEYVMGKMSVILILLSAVTWIPQLLLFFLQSYLEGFGWFRANLWIASAIILASVVWILLLALLSQTISALVKWRVVASAAMLGLFLIPSVFGEFINQVFVTRWGSIVSLGGLINNVTAGLFGTFQPVYEKRQIIDWDTGAVRQILLTEPPLWVSWMMLFIICAVCLAVLHWKVKAYEVVR
ncbi:MAG TPA: ABC transporter permease subunit [Pyrinomonadaceae bacterium]|nr:ABC transporter permease subunit [Pyrinomonadaceae bacterium]